MSYRRRFIFFFALTLCCAARLAAEVRVNVGVSVPNGDGRVTVEVRLDSDGESVGGVQNDILFNHDVLALSTRDCIIHPAIGLFPPSAPDGTSCLDDASIGACKSLHKNIVVCDGASGAHRCPSHDATEISYFRAIIAATATPNYHEIPDGVLYTCTFRVLDPARLPQRLVNRNVVASTPFGDRLPEARGEDGSICLAAGASRLCAERVALGQPCTGAIDCLPNECDSITRICVPGATPTPPPSATPTRSPTATAPALRGGPGDSCVDAGDCRAGLSCNQSEGGICCTSETCPPGKSCRLPGIEGFCLQIPATPTPTSAPKPIGEPCAADYQCESASCVDGACCTLPRCPDGASCNVRGAQGDCAPLHADGEACERDLDCSSSYCLSAFGESGSAGTCAPAPNVGHLTLIVGPRRELGLPPQFVAAGDFNDDDVDDVVVSSPGAILPSSWDGSFEEPITLPGAVHLGQLTTVDLNRDGDADIVALVSEPPALTWSLSRGDGSFGDLANLPLPSVPVALAARGLESEAMPEIAVAGADGILRIFRDPNADGGTLTLTQSIDLGGNLIEIEIADINIDGIRDLVVLDGHRLIVLLNYGGGSFERHDVPLGGESIAMAVEDFGNDAVPEIALLSMRSGDPHITLLWNESSGASFVEHESLPVSCPGSFNGEPITCAVTDLVAGDLNLDGYADLAVAISTSFADFPNRQVPGLIHGFVGLGDGKFLFSTRVNVGLGPKQLAIGDFTGDLYNEIVVAEEQIDSIDGFPMGSSVRIVRAGGGPGPSRPNGEPCLVGRQCVSGMCADERCCDTASCTEGERCDISGFEGQCHRLAELGNPCNDSEECGSGFCVDRRCCVAPQCPSGFVCTVGACTEPIAAGAPCSADDECTAGSCSDGACEAAENGDQLADAGDDGCNLSSSPAGIGHLWLLAGAGLLLYCRRRLKHRPAPLAILA